ncbi:MULTISPECIES: hypothetical protein [Streptomyces]|uniref:hypothetical protein n=1 Tax=Streptomyces TaxID=1883 RepID=UPI000B2889D3|nr:MULTISPECIES: hypothetical protein [Streptomyces]QXQ96990.1 hypothetical protein KV381_11860 [Streptomyces sp. WY228]WKN14836.1 hypothetical protein NEH83_11790 [Streptomyces sp. JUS-F4]
MVGVQRGKRLAIEVLIQIGQSDAVGDEVDEPIFDPESATSLEKDDRWFERIWEVR